MSSTPTPAPQVSPAKLAAPIVVQLLSVDQIHPDPNQPRKVFDETSLKELAESIKVDGLVQPIVVRPNGKGFYIVAGERRHRAAKIAGLKEMPAFIRVDLKDADVTTLQLVENIQREDLSMAEQCDAVAKLVKKLGTAKAVADKLGKSEPWVSKRANAHTLPPEVKVCVEKGQIVDIEIAAGLGEFKDLVKDQKEKCWSLDRCMRAAKAGTLTRDQLRAAIRDEKQEQEWARKQAEEEAKEEAREKARAEAAAKGGKAGKAEESKERDRYAEAQRRIGRVMTDRKNLKDKATAALYEGMKLGKHDTWKAPLRFEYVESGSDYASFPKSAEACHYAANAKGDITMLKRIASGLTGTVKVRMAEIDDLTLDEAQRISDALKGQPSLKHLFLSFEHEITGAGLRGAVKKLAPDQASTLPLPREEREAAKKKAAGKPPAKAAKKAASKKKH